MALEPIATAGLFAACLGLAAVFLWIRQRRKLERAYARLAADFAETEEVALTGHWADDPRRRMTHWSPGVYRIFGLDAKKFRPNWTDTLALVVAEHRDILSQELRALQQSGGHGYIEARIHRSDGDLRDVVITARCKTDSRGNYAGMAGVISDVTELKAAERAIADREEQLQRAVSAARAAMWDWDLDTNAVSISSRFGEMVGLPTDPWTHSGDLVERLLNPLDRPRLQDALRDHIKGGVPFEIEFRLRHTDGHDIWVQTRGRAVAFRNGKPTRMVGSMVDVTQRREMDAALAQKQQTLELAVAASQAGYLEYRYDTGICTWSNRLRDILGVPADFPANHDYIAQQVYSDDQPDYLLAVEQFGRTGEPLDIEVRVRHVEGHYVWLHIRAVFQVDSTGRRISSIGFVLDDSSRREAQRALADSERKFRNLVEGSIQGVVIHHRYRPLFCNAAYARMLGYNNPTEVLGLGSLKRHFSPEYLEVADDIWDRAITGELDGRFFRRRIINRAGREMWWDHVGRMIHWEGEPAWQTAVVDVTEQKRIEDELRASEERFRLLADNATDVITFYDERGNVQYMSPSVWRLTGYTVEESMGRSPFEIVHPADLAQLKAQRQLNGPGGPQGGTAVWRLRHKEGHWVWMESRASVIPREDGHFGIVAAARDVTERVLREQELQATRDRLQEQADQLAALAQTLEEERERAERANTAKSQFLAMMSHELRTPMTGVIGMADLLMISGLSGEQEGLTKLLLRSARGLLDLLNDLLDFSKIEADQLEIDSIPFSVSEVVREVGELYATTLADKGLTFTTEIAPDVQDAVRGDPKRLRQVLGNLVNNAAKFTSSGGIAVSVGFTSATDDDMELRFAVEDTGIGIAASDASRLFRPFVQADLSTSRQYGGSGLGLAICKRLVVAMGGDITLESEPGQGSIFRFTVKVSAAEGAAVRTESAVPPALASGRVLDILIADDNETTRYLLSAMLSRLGHRTSTVDDGQQAFDAAAARHFDIVLMDMQMPVMDGATATRGIRSLPGPAGQVPVIALTADAIPEHHPGFLAAGAHNVVVKPEVCRELGAAIDRLVPGAGVGAGMAKGVSRSDARELSARIHKAGASPTVLDETALNDLIGTLGADAVANMLPTFVGNMIDYRDRMAAAVAAGDLTESKRTAHAMKGLAAQFGAPQVSAIAKSIEQDAVTLADVASQMPSLVGAVAAAAQAIRLRPAASSTADQPKSARASA